MRTLKRDAATDTAGGVKNDFDPQKFKDEILENNRQMQQTIIGTVQSTLEGFKKGSESESEPKSKSKGKLSEEFAAEMSDLEIGEEQLGALVSLTKKVLNKNAQPFEDRILNRVDNTLTFKDQQRAFNDDVAAKFPQVVNKGSPLNKEATKIFTSMPEAAKQLPDAMANAVLRAAFNLGIQPVTPSSINVNDANEETGGVGATRRAKQGPQLSETDIDFAASFGVKREKLEEKLKQTLNTRRPDRK